MAEAEWKTHREEGLARLRAGDLQGAEPALEEALRAAPPSDSRTAQSLGDLAELHQARGCLDAAEHSLSQAVNLWHPLASQSARQLSDALAALAKVLYAQSRRWEAEAVLNRAWVIQLSGNAPRLFFHEVAAAGHCCRVFRAALKAIRLKLHPEGAAVLYDGQVRAGFGRVSAPDRGVAILSKPFGLLVVEPLEWIHRPWLEELAAAVAERLQKLDASLTPPSQESWEELRRAGLEHMEAGQIDEAMADLEQALDLAELWGLHDPRVAVSLNAVAQLYVATRRPGDAEAALVRAQEILEPLSQPLELAATLTQLAHLRGPGSEALLDRAWVLTMQADRRPKAKPAPAPAPVKVVRDPRLVPFRRCLYNLMADLRAERILVLQCEGERFLVRSRTGFPDEPVEALDVQRELLREVAVSGAPHDTPSGLCVPLWDPSGDIFGLLYVDSSAPDAFSRRDMQSLQLRARQLEQELFPL